MKIHKQGSPSLSAVCREVSPEAPHINLAINAMWETMYANKGIGLAANQVGLLDRVIIIDVNGLRQVFINPIITKKFGGTAMSREGCLSFPGVIVKKLRYKRITVEGFDQDWNPIVFKLKGLNAYCVQHEIDHLNGVTIK